MSSRDEESLSRDELRKKLFQTFKDKGMLDSIKAQLRNQLIQELNPAPLRRSEPARAEPLLVTACNNIIADHLQHAGHEYTLSVFYPDCGLSREKVLRKEDLLQLLKVHPHSEMYISLLTSNNSDGNSFLMNLLTHLTGHYNYAKCNDADTQTTAARPGECLVEKLKMIDQEYEGAIHNDKRFSFQSRIASYKRELETQMEMEMNTKLEHFKNVEIAKVKMEEESHFQKEFHNLKKDLEIKFEMKAKALADREKNAIDRLQKQQEIEEKNLYMERQMLLKESDKLRSRENELKLSTESFEKMCQLHQEKVKTTEDLLRRRELAVRTLEDTHDQRLKNELSRYQLELKEEYIKRTETLTESENKNKEETARIQKESAIVNANLEEQNKMRAEVQRLQAELEAAEQQTSLLSQQNELLKERLDHVSDYPVLKKEKVQLQEQVQLLGRQLDEAQEQNRQLSADISKPSKEEQSLQLELRRLQSARRLDEEEFQLQMQMLQKQLQAEVERCGHLKVQLMESEERSQWLAGHVEEIKTQLRQSQQETGESAAMSEIERIHQDDSTDRYWISHVAPALENEVLRQHKPSSHVDRLAPELSPDIPDIFGDRTRPRGRTGHDGVCTAGGHKLLWKDSPDNDKEMVAEAKVQILELWKEAETLQEAFRNYQQRAAQPTASLMSPSRPFSPPVQSDRQISYLTQQPRPTYTSRTVPSESTKTSAHPHSHVTNQTNKIQLKHSGLFDHQHSVVRSSQKQQSPPLRCLSPSRKNRPRTSTEVFPVDLSEPVLSWQFAEQMSIVPDLAVDDDKVLSPGDFSPKLPRSPQLQSTARDPPSGPNVHSVASSAESSPKPESINIEDLTEEVPDPGRIPELLLDTGVPLSKEAPDGPSVPRLRTPPQDLPEAPIDRHSPVEPSRHTPEDEQASWIRERKERQEQRRLEQEHAREKEVQERERLEMEMQEEQPDETSGEEEKVDEQSKPAEENPLDKYMKMVLEAREKTHTESPKQEAGTLSPELKTLSDKDNSVVQFSHHDADEDDFW